MDQTKSELPPEYSSSSAQLLADEQPTAPHYGYNANLQQSSYGTLANNATVVTQPEPTNEVVLTSINNRRALACFATFCCILPLGLKATKLATEARAAFAKNDILEAQRLADESKSLSLQSIAIGIVVIPILITGIVLFWYYFEYK